MMFVVANYAFGPWLDLFDPQEEEEEEEEGTDPRKREYSLLEAIGKTKYHKVEAKLTAKAVMNLGDNPLVSAIRVSSIPTFSPV